MAELAPERLISWGVAVKPIEGERVSGDSYLVKPLTDGAIFAVVDGLGHGHRAEFASKLATKSIDESDQRSPVELLRQCHEAIRGTRGAAATVAVVNSVAERLEWAGIGNVEGMLIRCERSSGFRRHSLMVKPGIVGYQFPSLEVFALPIYSGDLLLFWSDGVDTRFLEKPLDCSDDVQVIADEIFSRHWNGADDGTLLVARFGDPIPRRRGRLPGEAA